MVAAAVAASLLVAATTAGAPLALPTTPRSAIKQTHLLTTLSHAPTLPNKHSPAEAPAAGAGAEKFIGWRGETYAPLDGGTGGNGGSTGGSTGGGDRRRWVETLSWRPRAFLFHNFLSQAEADHVVALVEAKLKRSTVIDAASGVQQLDPIRTSWGAAIE